jgi:hypothetical protein
VYTALFRRFPPCLASTGDFFNSPLVRADLLGLAEAGLDQCRERAHRVLLVSPSMSSRTVEPRLAASIMTPMMLLPLTRRLPFSSSISLLN